MKYVYYPGCSLQSTAQAYDASTRVVCRLFDIELIELEDWNCCGATAYMSIKEILSFAMSARNLALAEELGYDIVAPCSACYTNLKKTNTYLKEFPDLKEKIDQALDAGGLKYNGTIKVKHLIEVFIKDIGFDKIKEKIKKPLEGLKVAAYYGCQVVRPSCDFDDCEDPKSFDDLIRAMGAEPVKFQMKAKCCGGTIMWTKPEIGVRLSKNIILNAQINGADIIATCCPLCQVNLEYYQEKMNKQFNLNLNMPIVFFTQLLGVAMDLPADSLELESLYVPPAKALAKYV